VISLELDCLQALGIKRYTFDANDGFPWLIMDATRGKKTIKGGTL